VSASTRPRLSLLWSAGAARVLGETSLLAALVWAALLWLDAESPRMLINFFRQGTIYIMPGCALIAALRLRFPGGRVSRQVAETLGFAVALAAGLGLILLAYMLFAGGGDPAILPPSPPRDKLFFTLLWTAIAGIFTVAFRGAARLWLFWDRLQRQSLVWSFTHAHLLLVVGISLLFALFLTITFGVLFPFSVSEIGSSGPLLTLVARLLAGVFPLLSVLVVVTVIVLGVVLPPSALFSYVVSRRVTRRLARLAAATGALRAGQYEARSAVEGEDEVARLQEAFNSMAAELQSAVRALRAERDTVAALSQARRELVAGVSHELRTPVATLRGYIESTLNEHDGPVPPPLRHDLEVMEHEVLRLQTLINDLFTMARVESGRLPLQLAPTDVGALVERLVETAAPLVWQSSKVQVVADVLPDLPPAQADAGRLEQVISNLLHNAVRHTAAGGLVGVGVAAEPEVIVVRVQDTGEGIAAEDLPRIWERFYRADGAAHPDEGAGLGLALVKQLTEAMGGTVAVESTPGEGSCFFIRLPRAA
jgi:signal transduction histidine kinase